MPILKVTPKILQTVVTLKTAENKAKQECQLIIDTCFEMSEFAGKNLSITKIDDAGFHFDEVVTKPELVKDSGEGSEG